MHRNAPADAPTHGSAEERPNRLYNSREARELLGGISERKFRQLTADGLLRAKKQGAFVYVSQDAIDAYIASLPDATTPPAPRGRAA